MIYEFVKEKDNLPLTVVSVTAIRLGMRVYKAVPFIHKWDNENNTNSVLLQFEILL